MEGTAQTPQKSPEAEQLLAIVTQYRATLKPLATDIKNIKAHAFFDSKIHYPGGVDATADKGEMIANITLAYRHMEDARMRLGKVFEAYFGEGIGDGPVAAQQFGVQK